MFKISFKYSIFLSLIFLCSFCFITPSLAQEAEPWINLSIYGGQILDIVIDPCNPSKMFAGSYLGGSLFVTEDGGNNWQGVLTGHESSGLDTEETFRNTVVRAVKIASPPHNDVIWVAHNEWIKKSTDGGNTWTHINNKTMQRDCPNCGGDIDDNRFCYSLTIHPSDPQLVYVGTSGPDGEYFPGAIYKTVDGGGLWKKISLIPDPVYGIVFDVVDLAIHPDSPNTVWAATYTSLYRSEDGGDSWDWIDSFNFCYDIEIKPNNPNEVYIASYGGISKVYYDQDLEEWQSISIAPGSSNVRTIAFDPQNPEVLYAAWRDPNHPIVAKSSNGGVDWEFYTGEYQFLTLAVHPTNNEVIFGGELNLGLYKSTDHGQTWDPINKGINSVRVYDIDVNPNNRSHILAATSSGVYEKKGDTVWSLISRFKYSAAFSIAFHPTRRNTYYAGLEGEFAKTMDGGIEWTFSNSLDASGDLNNYVSDIAIHPTNIDPKTTSIFISVYSLSGIYGDIYKSINGGDNFVRVREGVNKQDEEYCFNTVAIDPSDPNHIFAGGGNFYIPVVYGDLWESSDGGDNWIRTGLQDEVVNSLIINPHDPNIIYAGCGPSSGADNPVYISTNGGRTFEPSFAGMYRKLLELYAVWGDDPEDIFVVGENGIILHYNGTWTSMISNTRERLNDIWGASKNDIFAVGKKGTIIHYDGKWSAMNSWTTQDLCSVWGTSPTDVFAVGSKGTILHYNGIWSSMSSGITEDLCGVWGTSPTDVFAVGSEGTILHYNGAWSPMDSNTTISLSKAWGSSPTDIYVVGSNNTILHYDGNSWDTMDINISEENLLDIWGFSGSDIFITGNKGNILHYNGSVWTIFKEWWISGNAVVDLEFHSRNNNVIYAGTPSTGIYISPNQGKNWLDLGKPDFFVFSVAASSLYAGTEGGLWQCTGTGIIAGQIRDPVSNSAISNALVFNDWVKTLSVNGEYMLVSPAGICDVAAIADNYIYRLKKDIAVYGGDITWVDFGIQSGIPNLLPVYDSNGGQNGKGKTCFIAAISRY